MSTYYLGVDGGQSSTTALLGDETGKILGYGRGGPCNHVQASEGRAKFLWAMEGCLTPAFAQAGLDAKTTRIAHAFLGFSGGPADKEALLHEILPADHIHVTNDALIALSGATAGEPGIIVIAGTGSIAYGRNAAGKGARAGGWGFAFGDEGGGYDLTRQALRAALRMEEGWGPPTVLRERLLEATSQPDANHMLHAFYTTDFPRPRIASFSKIVDAAAMEGDVVAREILNNAAHQLASYAAAVRGQLFQPAEPARVAHIGGVWKSEWLRERFTSLVELVDGNTVGAPLYSPATGALLEAYRAAKLRVRLTNVPESEK